MIKCDGINGEVSINGSCGIIFSEMEMLIMSIKEQMLKATPSESGTIRGEFTSRMLRMCKYDSLEEYIHSLEMGVDIDIKDIMAIGGKE